MAKSQPLSEDIRTQLDDHFAQYKAQSEKQKADAWEAAVPPEAVDLVNHPKFLEHLDERKDISAQDARYGQNLVSPRMPIGDILDNKWIGATHERNYNADFEMTKKDVADIKAGRWSEPLVQKLRNDLERRDNDPLYNPENNSEMLVNNSETLVETPSQKLYREISDAKGIEEADANIAIIEGRAKAMGITPDELIIKHPVEVRNMTHMDGVDYVQDSSSSYLFQKSDSEIKQEVNKAIQRALNDRRSDGKVEFGTLSDHAVDFIQTHTGMNLKDYQIVLPDRSIRHIQRDHAVDIPLLADMMDVVRDFDHVAKSVVRNKGTGKNEVFVEFYKRMKDGVVKSVKFRDFDDKQLVLKTFFKMDGIDQKLLQDSRLSPRYEKPHPAGSTSKTKPDGFDGSKATDTESLHQKNPDVKLTDEQINAMIEFGIRDVGAMKAIIRLFKTADASTLPHELMHWMEKTLSDVERAAVDDILKDYKEGTQRSEALARLFEKYLADGDAPTPELKSAFEKFRNWLTKLWENIAHNKERDFELNDGHRELYRALLGDKESAAKLSERYKGIVQEKIKAEAETLFQNSDETTRLFQKHEVQSTESEQKTYVATKNILEKMLDKIGDGIEKGADMLPDNVRPWLHPTKAQHLFAEYQSAMREETAKIWEHEPTQALYLNSNPLYLQRA